jgi:transcriptional regulator with XRE-family HTH domain
MERFAKRLRERARELELSDAEVARRAGLAERRYGHYVRGVREPDFETLLRICAALDVTPNDLLIASEREKPDDRERWLSRLSATARKLETDDLRLAVRQIEALFEHRAPTQQR